MKGPHESEPRSHGPDQTGAATRSSNCLIGAVGQVIGRAAGADGSTRTVGAFAPESHSTVAALRVRRPVESAIPQRLYRHIARSVCRWNAKFSEELAEASPFDARECVDGKDATTLARDFLALDQNRCSVASLSTENIYRAGEARPLVPARKPAIRPATRSRHVRGDRRGPAARLEYGGTRLLRRTSRRHLRVACCECACQ